MILRSRFKSKKSAQLASLTSNDISKDKKVFGRASHISKPEEHQEEKSKGQVFSNKNGYGKGTPLFKKIVEKVVSAVWNGWDEKSRIKTQNITQLKSEKTLRNFKRDSQKLENQCLKEGGISEIDHEKKTFPTGSSLTLKQSLKKSFEGWHHVALIGAGVAVAVGGAAILASGALSLSFPMFVIGASLIVMGAVMTIVGRLSWVDLERAQTKKEAEAIQAKAKEIIDLAQSIEKELTFADKKLVEQKTLVENMDILNKALLEEIEERKKEIQGKHFLDKKEAISFLKDIQDIRSYTQKIESLIKDTIKKDLKQVREDLHEHNQNIRHETEKAQKILDEVRVMQVEKLKDKLPKLIDLASAHLTNVIHYSSKSDETIKDLKKVSKDLKTVLKSIEGIEATIHTLEKEANLKSARREEALKKKQARLEAAQARAEDMSELVTDLFENIETIQTHLENVVENNEEIQKQGEAIVDHAYNIKSIIGRSELEVAKKIALGAVGAAAASTIGLGIVGVALTTVGASYSQEVYAGYQKVSSGYRYLKSFWKNSPQT